MEGFRLARGLAVDEWISEVGGGMNLIVYTFSCRRYGLRRYEKTPRDELTGGVR